MQILKGKFAIHPSWSDKLMISYSDTSPAIFLRVLMGGSQVDCINRGVQIERIS